MTKKTIKIYKITNLINDKIYIGQTIQSLEKRFQDHCTSTHSCPKMKNAINKYGKDNFSIELLTACEGQKCANCIETFYISIYDSVKNGYNIVEIVDGSGGMTGRRHLQSSRKLMSEKLKGKHTSPTTEFKKGSETWNKGISRTNDVKAKISAAHKGMKRSEESKRKQSESSQNRTWKLIGGKRVYSIKGETNV